MTILYKKLKNSFRQNLRSEEKFILQRKSAAGGKTMGFEKMKRRTALFPIIILLVLILLFFGRVFSAALPFLFGFLAASALHEPARRLSRKLHIRYRAAAVFLTVFSVSVILGLFGVLLWQTVSEISGFAKETLNGENTLLENFSAVLQRVSDGIMGLPFFSQNGTEDLKEGVLQAFSDMVRNLFVSAASRFPAFASKLVSAIPQIFVFCVITVLSAVYFCMDYEAVCAFFRSLIPTVRQEAADAVLNTLKRTALQFLKSYLILFLLMFAGLFLGFALLGERYAFLFALMTAAVDSLPIFGMGIIILPLALFHFLTGDFAYGIGLCALYLILTVFRQILEPKILGAGLGVHPLVMLCAMYAGLKWFGVFGMLTAPFLTVTVKNLLKMKNAEEFSRSAEEAVR